MQDVEFSTAGTDVHVKIFHKCLTNIKL